MVIFHGELLNNQMVNIVMSLEMSVWVPLISSISQEEALRDVERRHSFQKCSWLKTAKTWNDVMFIK